jgi:hypothetical protein
MPKIIEAIDPEEIRQRRLVAKITDLETMNRATTMLNGRLALLSERETLEFSFTREGLPHTILRDLGDHFRSKGWEVLVYDDPTSDLGLVIGWPGHRFPS